MFQVCEQFSAKPTEALEPALTALELTNPRHAPTSDGTAAAAGEDEVT